MALRTSPAISDHAVRIVFFGTPAPAAAALQALIDAGHDVVAVVTQPDRRRGRGSATMPSPVRTVADDHGLLVLTPERAGSIVDELAPLEPDLGVVVAFGQLLPDDLLAVFPAGCINVHYSLLPRWRGAAPVERAILAGDTETGVAIMAVVAALDAGDVYAVAREPIEPDDTSGALLGRLSALGASLLVDTLPRVGVISPQPQVGEATYAAKLSVEEFELDWHQPAVVLDRIIRAGSPRPGAWTTLDGARFKVLAADVIADPGVEPGAVTGSGVVATGDGGLRLRTVQPEGKAAMDVGAWLAGRRGAPVRFGS